MRVIDNTPFQDAQGNINIISRIQGTLQYGTSWFSELEAQKAVVAQLDRFLDKGFVLIRNFTLPNSTIVIPLVLLGPGSFHLIFATAVRGQFEAKGMEWNTVKNGVPTPASRNLIDLVSKLTRAFQKYLQINNIRIPMQLEPVLIATNPGANVETIRPAVRVVRSDAVKQFANTINQSSPVLRAEVLLSTAELILEPQPLSQQTPPEPAISVQTEERSMSRAQAIFNSAETAEPEMPEQAVSSLRSMPQPQARPAQQARPAKKKSPAISRNQIILLAVLGIFECCILFGGAYLLFFFNQ